MRGVKRLLFFLVSLILLVIPLYADDGGYSIEAYKVKIEVSEENIFNIREDIDVNFIAQRHGIYRKIPIKNRVTRIDGTVSQVIAKVSDVKSNTVSTGPNTLILIPIVTLVIVLMLCMVCGRNPREQIREYTYPPQRFNSAEVGMIWRGELTNTDVISLLFSLASKGYLRIIDLNNQEKSFNVERNLYSERILGYRIKETPNSFALDKIKDYDGEDEAEKIFFQELFKYRSRVEEKKLWERGGLPLRKIGQIVEARVRREYLFRKSVKRARLIAGILTTLSYITVIYKSFTYGGMQVYILPACISITLGIVGLALFSEIGYIYSMLLLIISGGSGIYTLWPLLRDYQELIPVITLSMVGSGLMYKLILNMRIRTPYGQKLYLEIRGFRRYLENVSHEGLMRFKQNHENYFDEMLAYMVALNISKEELGKFNSLIETQPTWYDGPHFNSSGFTNRLHEIIASVEKSMVAYIGD